MNSTFNEWKHLLTGVPQGSDLSPLLFNICRFDLLLFMFEFNVANYTDDTTPYVDKKIYMMCKKVRI